VGAGQGGLEGSSLRVGTGRIRFGGGLSERALDVLAGRRPPTPPRNAATVMLLRPGQNGNPGERPAGGSGGLEVYLLRRKASMVFAPGAFVFPGGSVDDRDAEQQVAWAGPGPAEWGATFDAPPDLACALVCAAVRETFEESGVLLAGPSVDRVVADTSGADWEEDRRALLDRSLSLAGLLRQRGLVLRSDLLRPWSRWITPTAEERRYDTRFFVAALPDGQRTRDVSTESDQVAWVRPADAVEAAQRGEMWMLPPTVATLTELSRYASVSDVLAAERVIRPRMPSARITDDGVFLVIPEDVA
jgi:8-oxo-dGTP pyrophosphatase MutT (NUDIX family)